MHLQKDSLPPTFPSVNSITGPGLGRVVKDVALAILPLCVDRQDLRLGFRVSGLLAFLTSFRG